MEDLFKGLIHMEGKTEAEVRLMAPLVLAYMGDAIYEVFVRGFLIAKKNVSVHELHKEATSYVKAKSQAEVVHALETRLSQEEWQVIKKGRNQKSSTVPKNAVLMDYKYATGFEALIGYLYYTNQIGRLSEVINMAIGIINEGKENEKI